MVQDPQILSLLKRLGHGVGYEIPEEEDLSETGANLEILSPAKQISEQEDPEFMNHAGHLGFVPLGYCMVRTGDLYCVNFKDPSKKGLYRFSRSTGEIDLVLNHLSTISRYKGK